jgi:hypothetical protein
MSEPFFSRWSQRKQALARGLPVDDPAPVKPAAATPQATPGSERQGLGAAVAPVSNTQGKAPVPAAQAQAKVQHEATKAAPLPTIEQARLLTPQSDFQPFMQPGVASEVRNAAVKQLFTDPHFNVMDGLDIYIGDYNMPDPMPAGMLQKMVGAQLLGLFPKTGDAAQQTGGMTDSGLLEAGPSAGLGENPEQSPASLECSPVVAQSPPYLPDSAGSASPVLQPPVTDLPEHDHPDLQLQPNHAPAGPSAGPSTA